jgi:polar amino acid transport system permease protein
MTFDLQVLASNWPSFARGLGGTVLICAVALPVGFALGLFLAFAASRFGRVIAATVRAYVEVIRNIPFLVQIFILYFALPGVGIKLDPTTAGSLALILYAAAYSSEIVRGALGTIPVGQAEAAAALGLTYQQSFRWVLLPQTLGYLLPAGSNLAITLVKESALLSVITVRELTFAAQDVIGRTFAPVEVFTLLALLYWVLTQLLTLTIRRLEQALQERRRLASHVQPLEQRS